jgi:hypothetical protein
MMPTNRACLYPHGVNRGFTLYRKKMVKEKRNGRKNMPCIRVGYCGSLLSSLALDKEIVGRVVWI